MNKFKNFIFGKTSPYPIATFRVLFGVYLLLYFLKFLPNVFLFFSNEGIYAPYLIPDIAPSPAVAFLIYTATLALMLAFTLGYKTRLVTPLLLIAFIYHFALSLAVKNCSYDRLIIMFLFLMSLGEIDGALSISKPEKKEVDAWLTRILCLQVTLFYFGTGFYKLFMPYWHSGEIIKMTMLSNWGTPLAFWFVNLGLPYIFYDIMTWGIIVTELVFGFLLYIRPIQKPVFLIGFLFHFSIWVFLGIVQFMICPLTYVLFMQGEEVKSLVHKIKSKFIGLQISETANAQT